MKLGNIGKERGEKSLQSLFDVDYSKVVENIIDKRTYPEEKRKIQINITIVPADERTKMRIHYDIKTTLSPIVGGNTEVEIQEHEDGTFETRPSISMSKLKGQVDYRDVLPDADGVYPEGEE